MTSPSEPRASVFHRTRAFFADHPWAWSVLILAGVAGVIAAIYLPYALRAGWYIDDWDFYVKMRDGGDGSLTSNISACANEIDGGRRAACIYHGGVYTLLGEFRLGYHLLHMLTLWLIAGLAYTCGRLVRMPIGWAALLAFVIVLYPASNSTRLWAVAAVGQYVLLLYLVGLTLALLALRASSRRSAIGLHVVSVGFTVLAASTYEIVIPLIALNGLVYLAAVRNRAAVARGVVDLGIAGVVGLMRLRSPATDDVFVIERSTEQTILRARLLLRRNWDVWHDVFTPGVLGLVILAVVLVAAVLVAVLVPRVRRRTLAWGAVFVVALGFVAATGLAYVSANDTYIPDTFSTYNRLNLAGSVASSVAFVAALALVLQIGRGIRVPALGYGAVALICVLVGLHALDMSTTHKRSWEESWRAQQHALEGYRVAMSTVDKQATIIGFDAPQWEAGWVPVFATTWDLRGALDYETDRDPQRARPAQEVTGCNAQGVVYGEELYARYRGETPLWFVSPDRREAVRVVNRRTCERTLAAWGYAPLWGRTVTAPQAVADELPIATGVASTTSQ